MWLATSSLSRNGSAVPYPRSPDRVIPNRIARVRSSPEYDSRQTTATSEQEETKLHVKAFLRLLFEYAMKWKLLTLPRNLMTLLKVKGWKKKPHKRRGMAPFAPALSLSNAFGYSST